MTRSCSEQANVVNTANCRKSVRRPRFISIMSCRELSVDRPPLKILPERVFRVRFENGQSKQLSTPSLEKTCLCSIRGRNLGPNISAGTVKKSGR